MGPVDEAQAYFEGLGFERPKRQPLADYLSSVADVHARTVREGYENKIPRSAKEMEEAFRKTDHWRNNLQEIDDYREHVKQDEPADTFREAAIAERASKGSSKKSNYTLSFYAQTVALAKRQYLVQLGDPLSLGARYVSAIFQAIVRTMSCASPESISVRAQIIGSLFYNIPETTNGAFLRGGVAFFALLFNALLAQSELSSARVQGMRPDLLAHSCPGLQLTPDPVEAKVVRLLPSLGLGARHPPRRRPHPRHPDPALLRRDLLYGACPGLT
jgi:hypothetical protein